MSFLEKFRIRLDRLPALFLIVACNGQIFVWSIHPGTVEVWKVAVLIASLLFTVLSLYHVLSGDHGQDHVTLFLKVWGFVLAFALVELVVCRLLGSIVSALVGIILLFLVVDLRPLITPAAARSGKSS